MHNPAPVADAYVIINSSGLWCWRLRAPVETFNRRR
jgi:hypothetical protein